MPLGMDALLRFEEICTAAIEAPEQITDWERNFIQSQLENHKKYGENVKISAKQWAVLEKIAVKLALGGDPHAPQEGDMYE